MISRTLAVASIVTLALIVSGCDSKPTHESMAKDMIGKMKEMVAILKTVKDEPTAKAAKPKLEKLKKEINTLEAEADKLPKQTAEEEKKLKEKYEPELEKLTGELMTEMFRIGSDPKLSAELDAVMQSS